MPPSSRNTPGWIWTRPPSRNTGRLTLRRTHCRRAAPARALSRRCRCTPTTPASRGRISMPSSIAGSIHPSWTSCSRLNRRSQPLGQPAHDGWARLGRLPHVAAGEDAAVLGPAVLQQQVEVLDGALLVVLAIDQQQRRTGPLQDALIEQRQLADACGVVLIARA